MVDGAVLLLPGQTLQGGREKAGARETDHGRTQTTLGGVGRRGGRDYGPPADVCVTDCATPTFDATAMSQHGRLRRPISN